MDLHRGTKHKTLATRASHTLYFDTILLTNGGPTTRYSSVPLCLVLVITIATVVASRWEDT